MPNKVAHFAIEADDVDRARAFYETVFGWTFKAWGPPDFYLIDGAGLHGALQKRATALPPGTKGFECSIAVDDLEGAMKTIESAGGRILGEKYTIPTVGVLAKFADTENNEAIVIQYDGETAASLGLKD